MANDVIAADVKLSNAYMVVKIAAEVAAVMLTIQMLNRTGPAPAAMFWDRVRSVSQRTALGMGRLGLYAEARYQELIK